MATASRPSGDLAAPAISELVVHSVGADIFAISAKTLLDRSAPVVETSGDYVTSSSGQLVPDEASRAT